MSQHPRLPWAIKHFHPSSGEYCGSATSSPARVSGPLLMTICLDGLQISSWRPIRSCVPSPHSCIPCWKASTCAASGPVIGDLLLKYLPQASWPIGPFPSLIWGSQCFHVMGVGCVRSRLEKRAKKALKWGFGPPKRPDFPC